MLPILPLIMRGEKRNNNINRITINRTTPIRIYELNKKFSISILKKQIQKTNIKNILEDYYEKGRNF